MTIKVGDKYKVEGQSKPLVIKRVILNGMVVASHTPDDPSKDQFLLNEELEDFKKIIPRK